MHRFPLPGRLRAWLAVIAGLALVATPAVSAAPKATPVILDSDIGDDIDDTWALGLLLRSPELDLKLAVGDHGKVIYRARLLAKFLERAGRGKTPIGLGLDVNAHGDGPQAAWVRDYDLNRYPGRVQADGVRAIIDVIMASPNPVTVIAIGPAPNIRAALEREPRIAQRARFVGMYGSVRRGYGGPTPVAEYNVKEDAKACQAALSAAWPATITPLDTCGVVDLAGDRFRRLQSSRDPVAAAILENYHLWRVAQAKPGDTVKPEERSSTLFDTVAVYLAITERGLKMEELPIRVTDDGFTRIDPAGKTLRVATEWTDIDGFRDFLTSRLTSGKAR